MTKPEKIQHLQSLINKEVDCWKIFQALCENGPWKYDTEESDIALCFMRTWPEEGIIAKLVLEDGICAPPDGEVGVIERILVGRYDKAQYIPIPEVTADIEENDLLWYKQTYGDPNWELELDEMRLEDLPEAVFEELYADVTGSVIVMD